MKTNFSKHMTEERADRYVMIATKVGFGEVRYTATEDKCGRLEVTRIVELTSTGVVIVRAMDRTVVTMYCATIATALNLLHMDRLPPELYRTIRTNEKRGYCNI